MSQGECVVYSPCEEIKTVEVTTCIESSGQVLKVPVYLCGVCPYSELIVGVRLYENNRVYATLVRKVHIENDYICRYCRKVYIGEFEFLITDDCDINTINTEILAHYIY